MPPVLSFLAEVLPPANSSEATGWLFVAIGGVALTVNQVLGGMSAFKKLRTPDPVSKAETDRINSLEADMRGLELRMERRIGEVMGSINTRLQSLETTISHLVGDFSRALGVLEGEAKAKAAAEAAAAAARK